MGNKILVNDSSSDELVPYIAQTISTWLIYNSHVGGKIGVQENMIDYPVKAYLVCHQKKWKIATFEENHPYLSYRRIDFYLQYMGVNHYFEFKQAKKETKGESEFQRVYNDLIRLAICKKKNPKDRCFFLMFGEAVAYKTFFVEGKNDNMQYSDFFVFLQNAQNTEKYFFLRIKLLQMILLPNHVMFYMIILKANTKRT